MPKIVELELNSQEDMDAVQRFARENVDYISSRGATLMSAIKNDDKGLFAVGLSKMLADAFTSGAAEQERKLKNAENDAKQRKGVAGK